MKLIVCEKPSVARQFASALKVNGQNDGYIENSEWIITWTVGHLVKLSYPEEYEPALKEWKIETLPFLPTEYKYEVIKDVEKQYEILKNLYHRKDVDTIYNAGDSGREGEYIQRLVFNQTGIEGKKRILRVWIDSQTDEEIKRGIREAKPENVYDNLSAAAFERAIEDYAIGINLSRILSLKYAYKMNQELGLKKYTSIAVGRVMTCVLGMIVDRENEINNFKPTDFYKIDATHDGFSSHWEAVPGSRFFESPLLYDKKGFKNEKDAIALVTELNNDNTLTVIKADKKTEKKNAPLLFNLAELQAECTKKFKISPDDTLSIAQELYEKKLTTYPRTDARVITTAVCKEIRNNLSNCIYEDIADNILENGWYKGIEKTKYCDDSKVTDHYAIIPTGDIGAYNSISGVTKDVYELIVKRFLSIFYPAAEYSKVELELIHTNKEHFFASEKVLKSLGYMEVLGKEIDDNRDIESNISKVNKGDIIKSSFSISKSTTNPPKRFTSGSMILAMENAGKLIEEEELREQIKGSGIGTSATRAGVITKLDKNGYIALNKKTQILTPTNVGYAIYKICKENCPTLLSPKATANWEMGLSQVEQGKITAGQYRNKLEDFVRRSVEEIKEKEGYERPSSNKKVVGKCPICGKDFYEVEKGYYCSGYKKGSKTSCNYSFRKETSGKMLPESAINALLQGKDTELIEGFISKKGNTYNAKLVVKDGEIKFEYEHEESNFACPKCARMLNKGKYNYMCECGVKIPFIVGSKDIGDEQVAKLLADGKTDILTGLVNKSGKEYSAYLAWDGKEVKMKYPADSTKLICPKCGKALEKGTYAYQCCECDFRVWHTISGKLLSEDEVNKVFTDLIIGPVSGFKSKEGNLFDAYIVFDGKNIFTVKHILSGRAISQDDVMQLLQNGHTEELSGFKSSKGNEFSAKLKLDNGAVKFDFGDDSKTKSKGKKTKKK